MVAGARIEGGGGSGTEVLPARVRKTIQSIKEIVGNHSDADIYSTLRESNMDPNETAQKLLNQDPFHEVRRKRDKKKENVPINRSVGPRRYYEDAGQGTRFHPSFARNVRIAGYSRNALHGTSREFRVVKDNRVLRNTNGELKPVALQLSTSTDKVSANAQEKGPTGTLGSQKPSGGRISSHASHGPAELHQKNALDNNSTGTSRKQVVEEKRAAPVTSASQVQVGKSNNPHQHSAMLPSTSSALGVYSSATDPVHVPSPDSRPSASVGAIKREVGVVGIRRQSSDNSSNQSSVPSGSFSNSLPQRDASSTEPFRPFSSIAKSDPPSQTSNSALPTMLGTRSFLSNQHSTRQHQQPAGHQRASQPNKEWKPKSSKKSGVNNPGIIGTPAKTVSPPADDPKLLASEAANLQDRLSGLNMSENQNVIIAQHIRVPEAERCQLIFGSFRADSDSSKDVVSELQASRATEEPNEDPTTSLSVSAPESSADDVSGSKQVVLLEDQARNPGTDSSLSELQLSDKRESSSPQDFDNYAEVGLVQESNPSYTPELQHHDPSVLPGFSAYDPQTGYDIPYFRPTLDETVRMQGIRSPQDVLSSHTANSIPASTIGMVQQQQPQLAQMYPQVHVSHFANLMPYRQFLSPVYVPPMAMPGYSNNPAYPHPSNGSSYLLMPGASSPHLTANNLKYGIQQFKPVPAGSPTGFGSFNNPTGYAINAPPGIVGGPAGMDDSSRIKYKDGNLYVPNPQAETSEIWIQNPREIPGLQSTPYYNMPGQTPHGAYLQSHTGHASFNAAVPQSSHMQFPGLYHPPQPAAIASPHHLGPPGVGGNVGVGVAAASPGPQVGAYQQPQLGHLNWTTNF